MLKQNNTVTVFGFTGWPCGGKTIAIERVKENLEEKWIDVLVLPEWATHFFTSLGMEMWENKIDPIEFQEVLIPFQKSHEDMIHALAKRYENDVVIILDRTIIDSLAYMQETLFNDILSPLWLSHGKLLTGERYDTILHLVTAADGAEEFYTLKNNAARRESPEEARSIDQKLRDVYSWAKNFTVIDNSTDFDTKIQRVQDVIFSRLWLE